MQYLKIMAAASILITAPVVHAQAPATSNNARRVDGFTLNFVDADAKRVIDAILGAMMGVDYSVDPTISGNITLNTAQPATRDELLPLLENALGAIGAVIVVQDGRYNVLPRDAARGRAPIAGGAIAETTPITPGFATEILTIESGNAEQIARLLRQFVGESVVASVEPSLNQIIISGNAEERSAARQLVARFDVDAMAEMQFEIVRLENVDVQTLIGELQEVFQPPYDIIGSRVRVIPLARLRSLLLIAAQQSDIERIKPWITRLDSGAAGRRRLYSYAVQNGRARDVAAILQRVLGVSGEDDGQSDTPSAAATPPASNRREISDGPPPRPNPAAGNVASETRQQPRIIASDETNSLLVYANGEEYAFIRDALERLDQPVPQVLIEAVLAEVTLTRDFQYGVNFRGLSGNFTATNSNTASGTPASIFPGLSVSWIGSNAAAVLNSLQSRTNVRVLSSPKLIVLNNQTATLQVGDQVPIVVQQVQSVSAPGAPVINSVELRDTGVILRVTPRVNDSGTVTLDISQEVSDVSRTTSSGINSPTIQQRRLTSVVATRSGELVALGGLIRERTINGRSGIPLLSQIPILGGLFGSQSNENSRTELIMLLTPTIVRAPQDSTAIVRQLIEQLDAAGPLANRGLDTTIGPNRDQNPPQ